MTNFMMTNLNIIKSIMYIKSFLQDLAMKRIRGATAIPDGPDHHTVDNILWFQNIVLLCVDYVVMYLLGNLLSAA